jgi:hypothetical protein
VAPVQEAMMEVILVLVALSVHGNLCMISVKTGRC